MCVCMNTEVCVVCHQMFNPSPACLAGSVSVVWPAVLFAYCKREDIGVF